jgi:hypothetical protein
MTLIPGVAFSIQHVKNAHVCGPRKFFLQSFSCRLSTKCVDNIKDFALQRIRTGNDFLAIKVCTFVHDENREDKLFSFKE